MEKYNKRIIDKLLEFRLSVFGAVSLRGPKGCGKTTSASRNAKTIIEFEDEDLRERYLYLAATRPSELLEGDKPILFDEWQDAPKIWGAIRSYVDKHPSDKGNFILTGSSSKKIKTAHTGTLRISEMEMLPMSLYESGDSSGEISLRDLISEGRDLPYCQSPFGLDEAIFLICRGGWPAILTIDDRKKQLYVARELYNATCRKDVAEMGEYTKNPRFARGVLKAYSRQTCNLASTKRIFADANAYCGLSETSFHNYVDALERLCIISEVEAWSPSLRSRANIRNSPKRNLVDPSIAASALNANEESLKRDFNTLGFLFESMCMRDLKAYASSFDGEVYYYRDRYGLEADAVLVYGDGKYALIEIKLNPLREDEAAKNLLGIEKKISDSNKISPEESRQRMPDAKIIVVADGFAHVRDDGIYVIPIGCLRD